jgi:hypothetical protein
VTAAAVMSSWAGLDTSELTGLHHAAGTPVTSRPAWWRAVAAYGGAPALVTVRGRRGTLTAAGLVVVHDRCGVRHVTSGRPAGDDAWEPAAVTPAARRALLTEIARFTHGPPGPWSLTMTGLRDEGDAAWLAGLLPGGEVTAAPPVPGIRFTPGTPVVFSGDVQRSLAQSGRRLRRERLSEDESVERDAYRVAGLRSEVESVHLAVDDRAGRRSDLDDDAAAGFWRAMYAGLTATGELEVATLRLDGQLAAYVVGVADGPVLRVIAGRAEPKWRQYAVGRRLEARVVRRAEEDGFRELDWGSSVAPGKLIFANVTDPRWSVRAAGGVA